MKAAPDREVEYLVRRFTLEKGFAVAGELDQDDRLAVSSIDPNRFGYELPVIHIPEVEPLKKHFSVVLIRANGISFTVLGIRKHEQHGHDEALSRDDLLEVGEACLQYTGKSSGVKIPAVIEVIEVHPGEPRPDAVHRLDALRKEDAKGNNVAIFAYSVGWRTGTVLAQTGRWTVARGRTRYLRRILKATGEPEHRMVERVENAGLNLPLILVGALAGLAVAIAVRYLLAYLGAESGQLYGAADYTGGFTALGVAVFARRIRAASALQAVLAAVSYSLLLYGGFIILFLGAPFSFWMVLNALVFTLTGFYIGAESEMA